MSSLIVEGGSPLSGEIRAQGNKNAALPMIAAALLTDEEVVLDNVPDILDVRSMLEIAAALGADVSFRAGRLSIRFGKVMDSIISRESCSKARTSILMAAPLLHRTGRSSFWPPGGDVIGRRRLDTHFYGLEKLGASLKSENPPYEFHVKDGLRGADMFFDEASVTATEHVMMGAVVARGLSVIRNAACEPHVQDLGELLMKMGARIEGLGTNTISIDGVERLHGACHTIAGDHIEAGSFLALAAATGGGVKVTGTMARHYWMLHRVFERFGVKVNIASDHVRVEPGQVLAVLPDMGNAIPVVSDGPWPQYPSDMMSCSIVMATQARGVSMFFEKMFESRIFFVDRLNMMGANAIVCDPHRAVISGPATLRPLDMASPDIRSGMALVIAALCAKGRSSIGNLGMISRGYENLVGKLQTLGAKAESAP